VCGYLHTGIVTLGFRDNPYPSWQITRTHTHGYRFAGVRVQVASKNPGFTHDDPYVCSQARQQDSWDGNLKTGTTRDGKEWYKFIGQRMREFAVRNMYRGSHSSPSFLIVF